MLSMEDIEETEIDDNQQVSTSTAEQTKHSPRIRSPRIHPKPEATNGPSNRRFSPEKQSSSFKTVDSSPPQQTNFQRSDPSPKSSDNSESHNSPSRVSGSSKVGRSSPNPLNGDDSVSHMGTNGDQQTISNKLFELAKKGDVAGIEKALTCDKNNDTFTDREFDSDKDGVDVQDKDGLSALHYAAREHHHAAVKVLLEKNADVSKKSRKSEMTPLMYACRNKPTSSSEQVSTVKELLSHEASLNDTDRDGFNALHHCALRGPLGICQLLIENESNIINARTKQGWTPLHIALMQWDNDESGKNRKDMVEFFLQNNAELDDIDGNKRTPLHIAAIKGNVEAAKLLLNSQKIDVDCEDEDKNTPLMLASKYDNTDLIKLLTNEYKCKIDHQNKDGMTALHYAALYGKTNAVEELLEHGPNDLDNKLKKSAFHLACENNNIECAKQLRDRKYAKDTPDEDGFTPFLQAVDKGFDEIVKDLMVSGEIDPCVKLGNGRNVLHIVAEKNRLKVLSILLEKQSTDHTLQREKTGIMSSINIIQKLLNAPDNDANKTTPLHTASRFGNVEVFELLLKYGASPVALDSAMKTPLHIASEKGFTSIIENMVMKNRELLYKKDENGDTVYHLAAGKGHDRLLDVLLLEDKENKISKSPECKNNDWRTPLWVAAKSGHLKCVEHLSTRTDLIEIANKSKLTPLMVASLNGHADVVEYLIKKNANVSAFDENYHNCLEIAILKHHESVAMTIIKSKQWKKALRNYTNDDDGMECTPFRKLVLYMPDCAKAVLDKCIMPSPDGEETDEAEIPDGEETDEAEISSDKHDGNEKRTKYLARFNFEFIDDLYFIKEWEDQTVVRTRNMKATKTQYSYKKKKDSPKAYENDSDKFKVQHPMMMMSEAGQLNLLVHPVVKGLRQHKWDKFAKCFYYVFFVVYAVYLSFLTAYVVMTPPPFAINQSTCGDYYDTGYRRPVSLHVVKTFLYVLTSLNVFKELIQLIMRRLQYFNFVNIMEIIIFVTSFLFVIDFDGCQFFTNYRYTFQWNLGAISIVLSWFGIVMYLQKWPDIGIYVVMLNKILRTLVKFFIIFVLFIVGFGLGFFCLLQNQTPFSTAPNAILRTSVMMIGELDFNDVFHDEVVHYWITYAFFCIFLIVMTIVIMNLMIGLAIDDIKAVQDHAKLKGIQMKVKLVLDVERLLLSVSQMGCCGKLIWPPEWYIDVYVKSFKSEEEMNKALSKNAEKYENQVEINQNKMIHKQKNLKKAMKTMKTEIDKQGVILEEIKRKLFEETSTG